MEDAFILGQDGIPDWFMDLVSTNQIILRGQDWGPIESAYIQGLGSKRSGEIVMRQDMPKPGEPESYPPRWLKKDL